MLSFSAISLSSATDFFFRSAISTGGGLRVWCGGGRTECLRPVTRDGGGDESRTTAGRRISAGNQMVRGTGPKLAATGGGGQVGYCPNRVTPYIAANSDAFRTFVRVRNPHGAAHLFQGGAAPGRSV